MFVLPIKHLRKHLNKMYKPLHYSVTYEKNVLEKFTDNFIEKFRTLYSAVMFACVIHHIFTRFLKEAQVSFEVF